MPGDDWQKFANLRLLYGLMWTHPGKKLLFMGGEFGQWTEWAHEGSVDWNAADTYFHVGIKHLIGALNHLMRTQPALHQRDFDGSGFEWISADDSAHSVLAYLRHGNDPKDTLLVVFNGTPVPHHNYRLGAPQGGRWQEIFNSDASIYGGTDVGNQGFVDAHDEGTHGRPYSLELTLPPLGLLVFKHVDTPAAKALPEAKAAAPAAKKPEAAPVAAKPAKAEAPAPKAAVAKTSAAPKAFETRAAEPKAAESKAAAPKAAAPKAAAPKTATTPRTRTSTAKTASAGTTAKATKAAAPKAASSRTTATTKAKPASSRSKG